MLSDSDGWVQHAQDKQGQCHHQTVGHWWPAKVNYDGGGDDDYDDDDDDNDDDDAVDDDKDKHDGYDDDDINDDKNCDVDNDDETGDTFVVIVIQFPVNVGTLLILMLLLMLQCF